MCWTYDEPFVFINILHRKMWFFLFVLILFQMIRLYIEIQTNCSYSQNGHITQTWTAYKTVVCVCGLTWSHSYGDKPTVYKTESVFAVSLHDLFVFPHACGCHSSTQKTQGFCIFLPNVWFITASICKYFEELKHVHNVEWNLSTVRIILISANTALELG